MSTKMNWLIDRYRADKCEYLIRKSGRDFGTVCVPTGVGKSGMMFEDAIYAIFKERLGNPFKKLIVNFSAPVLKLNQQTINDFIETIVAIWPDDMEKPGFFINSSDKGTNYDKLQVAGISAMNFSKIETSHCDVNIVASCHKSMQKFIDKMSSLQEAGNEYFTISYIDESHLLTIKNGEGEDTEEDATRVDFDKLLEISNRVYAVSATPEKRVTDILNKKEGISPQAIKDWANDNTKGKSPWVVFEKPVDAIQNCKILPPLIHISRVPPEVECITPAIAERFLDEAKGKLPGINHKVLITCKSCNDLLSLRAALEDDGYKVFSTNSKTGFGTSEIDLADDMTIKGFTDEVDNYNGDCFVLHVRQLIQGIDITSLTDAIIFTDANMNRMHSRHTIQTIGRIIRYGKDKNGASERGKKAADCDKPYGFVLFLIPEDNTNTETDIKRLVYDYYGHGASIFESAYSSGNYAEKTVEINFNDSPCYTEDNSVMTPLIIKALEELKVTYGPMMDIAKKIGNESVYRQLKVECDKKANSLYGFSGNTVDWLTNENVKQEFYDRVPSIFGIDSSFWRKLVA